MIERAITYAGAVNEALTQAMDQDPKVLCYGLGVTDPKHVFDTTQNLESKFGPERVFDIPCSENAITGIGVGAALRGYKSVITHQRLDFSLLSMDQIVNSAATVELKIMKLHLKMLLKYRALKWCRRLMCCQIQKFLPIKIKCQIVMMLLSGCQLLSRLYPSPNI